MVTPPSCEQPQATPRNVSALRLHFAPARKQLEEAERWEQRYSGEDEGDLSPSSGDGLFVKQPVARLVGSTVTASQPETSGTCSYVRSLRTRALHFMLSPRRDLGLVTAQRNLALAYVLLYWRSELSAGVGDTLHIVGRQAAEQHVLNTWPCDGSDPHSGGEAVHWLQRSPPGALAQVQQGTAEQNSSDGEQPLSGDSATTVPSPAATSPRSPAISTPTSPSADAE
jgi:hypothetical protein